MTKRRYTDEQKAMFMLQLETLDYPNNERALLEVSRPAGAPSQRTLRAWWNGKDDESAAKRDKVTLKKIAPSPDDIRELLEKFNGNVSAVARHLGYKSRGRLYRLINESEELQDTLDDSRETFVDDVESALFSNALDGNVAAQIFIMKAHPVAKLRGWGERQEIGGKDGGPIVVDHAHHFAEIPDDDLRRNLEALGRGALAASGRAPLPEHSGGIEGDDTTGEEE